MTTHGRESLASSCLASSLSSHNTTHRSSSSYPTTLHHTGGSTYASITNRTSLRSTAMSTSSRLNTTSTTRPSSSGTPYFVQPVAPSSVSLSPISDYILPVNTALSPSSTATSLDMVIFGALLLDLAVILAGLERAEDAADAEALIYIEQTLSKIEAFAKDLNIDPSIGNCGTQTKVKRGLFSDIGHILKSVVNVIGCTSIVLNEAKAELEKVNPDPETLLELVNDLKILGPDATLQDNDSPKSLTGSATRTSNPSSSSSIDQSSISNPPSSSSLLSSSSSSSSVLTSSSSSSTRSSSSSGSSSFSSSTTSSSMSSSSSSSAPASPSFVYPQDDINFFEGIPSDSSISVRFNSKAERSLSSNVQPYQIDVTKKKQASINECDFPNAQTVQASPYSGMNKFMTYGKTPRAFGGRAGVVWNQTPKWYVL